MVGSLACVVTFMGLGGCTAIFAQFMCLQQKMSYIPIPWIPEAKEID